jgi:hypothetical protein
MIKNKNKNKIGLDLIDIILKSDEMMKNKKYTVNEDSIDK